MTAVKRVAIVGSGAVGGYYGARLAESGMDVTFLLRSDYDHIAAHGWKVTSVAGDIRLPSVQCARCPEEMGKVDLVIIAWKATSNRSYGKVISPLLHDETVILTLQNGLGNVEELARLFGADRIFGGLCFVCINRIGPGELDHSASGMVHVGEFRAQDGLGSTAGSNRLGYLVGLLRQGGVVCQAVPNLEQAQWMKLVWNIPFNGLAIAQGGVDTGVLLATPGMEDRIRAIMREVQAVAAAMDYRIGDDFLEKQIALTRPMKAYRPSSMIDYVDGREVEVDAIWRQPLKRARALGVEVPEIERLLAEIEDRLDQRGI
ncbi:MAG: 2-dehydropantoate 2-reductase [Akkermansiaceae bacterium]|nr:2-dehydropantoate 2-reductase [Akkermansiaceae bacterium]